MSNLVLGPFYACFLSDFPENLIPGRIRARENPNNRLKRRHRIHRKNDPIVENLG